MVAERDIISLSSSMKVCCGELSHELDAYSIPEPGPLSDVMEYLIPFWLYYLNFPRLCMNNEIARYTRE